MKSHRMLFAMVALLVCMSAGLCVGAGSRGDAAGRRAACHVGRRNHPVLASERAARPAVPRSVEIDGHGERHLSRRLQARGLRRDRHGAPAGAHALQGLHQAPQHPEELQDRGSRPNGTTSYDRTNYFETSRRPTPTSMGARSRSRPHGERVRRRNDLDSEMTVVRNEFETGENSPLNMLCQRMLSTAYLWHNYGKSVIGVPRRHRARADRPAAGVLQEALSAGQRGARRRRQDSTRPGRSNSSRSTSDRFPSRSGRSRLSTPTSRRRTASGW